MRKAMVCLAAAAGACTLSSEVLAAVHQFSALLQTQQEVPPVTNAPNAIGTAQVSFDDSNNLLGWTVGWRGLTGDAIGAHFHGPAPVGQNAGIQVDIGAISGLSSPSSGSTTISSGQQGQLFDNQWYINVHTNLNPGGEIRGQLRRAGTHQNSPLFPDQGDPARGTWIFNNVTGDGAWFDPVPASGFLFQTIGGSNFIGVQLPVGLPDNNGTYIVDDGTGPVVVAAGGTHAFSPGVSSFTITDIDPEVDGSDPFAFPTFLQFDQQVVSFSMQAIPEPSMLGIMLIGGLCLGARRRR